MRRAFAIGVVIGLGTAALELHAQAPRRAEVQLRAAQYKADVEGDLKGAIDMYRRVVQAGDRPLAAAALVRMAECYEKLGDEQARRIFEQVVREYGDQKDAVAAARAHLGAAASTGPGLVTRQLWSVPPAALGERTADGLGTVSPDGRPSRSSTGRAASCSSTTSRRGRTAA